MASGKKVRYNAAMHPTLRAAAPADIDVILEMMVDFNRLEQIDFRPEVGRAALLRLLQDRGLGVVGLAALNGAAVGYLVVTWGFDLEWNGRDAFLTELYLREGLRGRGLGRWLLHAAERLAREAGAGALHLMVRHENQVAKALYQGEGYVSPPRHFFSKVL